MDADLWFEPDPADPAALALLGVNLHLTARPRPVLVLGTHGRLLDADRPDAPDTIEQGAQAIDGGEKVAAVLLHHRQQQVAAGVTTELVVLEAREAGQQDPPCLGLVTRQRQCTSEDIARWQHAELVPQHAGAPTPVDHGDDRVHPEPWVVFETADQTREPGAPAETPDIQPPQQHWRIVADLTGLDLAGSPGSAPVSPSPSGRGPGQGALRASPNPDTISPDRRHLGSGQE